MKNTKLKNYINEVWRLIREYFSTCNLNHISRGENELVDSLAIVASNFKVPLDIKTSYDVQTKHRPTIPDNIKHWQVFEDDREIKKFLECMEEFVNIQIDEEEEMAESEQNKSYKNNIAGHKTIELKTNHIPKGLVPLERIFDNNDAFLKPGEKAEGNSTVDCNIGTKNYPKFVKISKSLIEETRNKYKNLLRQYLDVFAWSYNDLKTYSKDIMEHKIPLKSDAKPMIQKVRHINPILLPIIEKEIKKLWEERIIIMLRFSNWVSNIVHVCKNNGEIRICVDFRNLNRCSLNYNYPLPKMDYIL